MKKKKIIILIIIAAVLLGWFFFLVWFKTNINYRITGTFLPDDPASGDIKIVTVELIERRYIFHDNKYNALINVNGTEKSSAVYPDGMTFFNMFDNKLRIMSDDRTKAFVISKYYTHDGFEYIIDVDMTGNVKQANLTIWNTISNETTTYTCNDISIEKYRK